MTLHDRGQKSGGERLVGRYSIVFQADAMGNSVGIGYKPQGKRRLDGARSLASLQGPDQ